jgi:hypothetical protein
LPDAGWRLLALLAGLGPVWWLVDEALRRRRAVRLTPTVVIVEQPILLFTRAMPYARIAGVLTTEHHARPALAYRRPRPPSGLPPRLGLIAFEPIENEAAFWETLTARAPTSITLSEGQVLRHLRARRYRRGALLVAVLLAVPFVVIVVSRTIGPLLP